MHIKKNQKIVIWFASFGAVILTSLIGGLFTRADSLWYQAIRPSLAPPSFVFGIVWTILYVLFGISAALALINSRKNFSKISAYFLGNYILQILWSLAFFTLELPLVSLIIILGIIIETIFVYRVCYHTNKNSAYLLIPFIAWISFATILNAQVVWNVFF